MTVNGSVFQLSSYQSFSYSSFSVSAFQATTQASAVDAGEPATSSSPAAPGADSVTLSAQATARANSSATSDSGTTTNGSAPTATSIFGTPADDRATALFKALDANQDGSVTEDEFKAGAKALLRRGRERDRAEGARHVEHGHHGGRRLERALERTFDRVDSDGDGALTKDELSAALTAASKRSEPLTPANSGASTDSATATSDSSVVSPAQQAASTSTFVSLTVVSIAIRTYTAVGQFGASNAPSTNSAQPAPAVSTPSAAPTTADAPGKADPLQDQR